MPKGLFFNGVPQRVIMLTRNEYAIHLKLLLNKNRQAYKQNESILI
jgi:hypothetical protein